MVDDKLIELSSDDVRVVEDEMKRLKRKSQKAKDLRTHRSKERVGGLIDRSKLPPLEKGGGMEHRPGCSMTPKEEEGGRLLYEKGYLINDIAEYYGVGRQTIRAIKDKRGWERKVGGVELKATEEDLKIMKEMVSAVPTLELAIPDVSKMGTLQLVQLQNLSRIDYMLSIGDIALKKLRSDAELLAGVGSSDEMVKLCASFEKVSRPIVRLMEERLLMVNSMPNLTQEESFEDNIRKVVDETDAAVRKERNEFQRSVMPDVVYDEKKAVSEGEEMRGRLERLGKNEEEMNLRRSSGLRNNSPEII